MARVGMIALLLAVMALGARGLGQDALWLDEYWSLAHAGGLESLSPVEVWGRIAASDPWQTPGYYLLLNLWGGRVGWSAFAGRALSLLAGMLAVAWVYR
ncbi:MAG: hypothetical protein K8I30_00710, partial [Anaerolineae bacterium]|nr:hypothetical protein [Anaerolineae bacterium]